jgi:hypothetical protein
VGCIILERLVSEVNGRREARLKEVERIRKVKEGRMVLPADGNSYVKVD